MPEGVRSELSARVTISLMLPKWCFSPHQGRCRGRKVAGLGIRWLYQ